jgi:hypothetical protein
MSKGYTLQGRAAPGYKTYAPKSGVPSATEGSACRSTVADGSPAGAAGLSKPHNRTGRPCQKPKPTITWYPGASLVEVHVPREHPSKPRKDTKPRGKIKEWSAGSRARLKRFMGTLRREDLKRAVLVTLTYPHMDEFGNIVFPAPDDHEVYKYHLKKFSTYLLRNWPNCSGVWKLEFQKRGAAHYHLMLYGMHDVVLQDLRAWIQEAWYQIAHNGDRHLGRTGTKVETIKSVGGAVSYLVKYLSKEDQTMPGNFTGRYWGRINKPFLPVVDPLTVEQDEKRANQLRRIARRKMQKDVEHSRWKRFEEKQREQFKHVGGRLFWEVLKSRRHGSRVTLDTERRQKPRFLRWSFKDGGAIEMDGETLFLPYEYRAVPFSVDMVRRDVRQLPKRWKARNNDRVRVMCDASAFMSKLEFLESPASSFLKWSRGTRHR